MKLFKISQTENTDYDTFDSAVVCAPNEETARNIHPMMGKDTSKVKVEYLGEAKDGLLEDVICASFNAG
jgi:hypothetical protein